MLKAPIRSGLFVLLCWATVDISAQQSPGNAMVYENHNQVDPKPLRLHSIDGVARDDEGKVIPSVVIGVFVEKGHTLIATAESSSKGYFALKHIPPGKYRIVAKHPAFCTANLPITIVPGVIGHPHEFLELHMKVGGIDTCSFGTLK